MEEFKPDDENGVVAEAVLAVAADRFIDRSPP